MEHKKSGARLVWLEREEENKTFSIAFQTQPSDDTGIFHILEHSVLCGSDRYPVKEPFVELLKSSLNTFLNAMTFPDKTVYPVSSRNDQDFINLMRVYMDAVLHPLIHSKPEIFGQEGWHYELDENGEPSYKGVVFNEMKGAMSSPDEIMDTEIQHRLFPDTCYRWNSGGDPAHIPELTYEQFTATHKRLYHPSNSYIFLDGHMDIEQILGILDKEYLSAYDRIPAPAPIALQAPVDGGTAEIEYELSAQEELEGRVRLADGFVYGTFADLETLDALEVLADVLCGDNQAPLKKRLLDAGLAKDVTIGSYFGSLQGRLHIEIRDVREDKLEEAAAAIYDELKHLAREGLDRKRIRATLDNKEFRERERDYGRMPQGLIFGFAVLESWLYGGDPAARLSVGDIYDRLRAKCDEGWFEDLLERVFLKNPHKCRVIMRPSHTLGREKQEAEAARLKAAQAAWSEADAEAVRQAQANIETWQNTPDTPEQLATIPMLRLDQIPAEPEKLPLEETEIAGLPVLLHRVPTGGITYLNLYFAMDDLTEEQVSQASFLAQLLGKLETENHALEDLQRELRSRFGQIAFIVESNGQQGNAGKCRSFLCASCSVLDSKLESGLELLAELLAGTKLDDAKHVSDYLVQRRPALAEQLTAAGHVTSMGRILARSSAYGVVQENAGGLTFLRWLTALEKDFQDRSPALLKDLKALAEKLFCHARLTLSVTGANPDAAGMAAKLLAQRLPEGCASGPQAVRPWAPKREGIVIPSDVGYAAMGGPVPSAANGGTQAAVRTASLAYLWNAVRVQGGAYGAGLVMWEPVRLGTFYSFRDPTPPPPRGWYPAPGGVVLVGKRVG
ncbi:MAG: insulinase family protein, partial [Oscillospiraceae bacterium]|nr:insulinase family protein [Oscillospiraceae bacterium]